MASMMEMDVGVGLELCFKAASVPRERGTNPQFPLLPPKSQCHLCFFLSIVLYKERSREREREREHNAWLRVETDGSSDGGEGLWRMEKGSSSLGATESSGANGSDESSSPNGLKFGKKIYFEDVGSAKPPAPAKKGRAGWQGGGGQQQQQQQQQQPRCQVEGCKVDLTGAKAYYCRHKVCGMHSKSSKVVVNGIEQRFCQQCSRFHQLHEFDQGKRSCRRRLAGHNERRRKPPPGPLSARYGDLSSPFHDDGRRLGGFLVDFTYPRQLGLTGVDWPDHHPLTYHPWHGALASSSRVPTELANPYERRSVGGSFLANHDVHSSGCIGDSDSSCALSLLSNKPWTATAAAAAASSRAPVISAHTYEVALASHSTGSTSFTSSPCNFKEPGTSGGMHGITPEMGLGPAGEPSSNRQFSGELELAFQGSREYGSSSSRFHRSL